MEWELGHLDWAGIVAAVSEDGWVRLEGIVDGRTCARLAGAAPGMWSVTRDVPGTSVHQDGLTCGTFFEQTTPDVRRFGLGICESINAVRPGGWEPLPCFNEAQWGRSRDGVMFITAHRDPPSVGGVIAITTIYGRAPFSIWHDGADPRRSDGTSLPSTEWETRDGDLVLVRANGWPSIDAACPVHRVESPVDGARMILTLRHNKTGPGSEYFPEVPPAH